MTDLLFKFLKIIKKLWFQNIHKNMKYNRNYRSVNKRDLTNLILNSRNESVFTEEASHKNESTINE